MDRWVNTHRVNEHQLAPTAVLVSTSEPNLVVLRTPSVGAG